MEWRVPDQDDTRTWNKGWGGPLCRLEQDWARAYGAAAIGCYEAIGAFTCTLDGLEIVHGWPYQRVPQVPDEEVRARRAAHAARNDALLAQGVDLWQAEIQPEVAGLLAVLRRRRPRSEALPGLVRHVERCLDAAAHIMGDLHWRFAFSYTSDWNASYAELTGGDPEEAALFLQGIDHMTSRLVRRLRALARLRVAGDTEAYDAAFADLLRRYGRRTGRGFGSASGFRDGTWSMDPQAVHDLIASYARADLDRLDDREREAKRTRHALVRRMRRRFAGTDVWPRLDLAHRSAILRVRGMENHNHLMEQETEGTLREAIDRLGRALVAAGRIDAADDVFHLNLDELRSAARNDTDLRPLVAANAAELEAQRALEPPPFLGAPPPPPEDPRALPGWQEPAAAAPPEPGTVVGTGASPGRATGRVVVAADTVVPPEVEPGDVVVARDAGPAWTPIFPLLGALVLDDGWTTQHAAIVCREFGIPCVLATRTATTTIAAGSTVTVDGTRGVVEIAV